jgi:hypothetical protein
MIAALAASPHRHALMASALLGAIVTLAIGLGLYAWSDVAERAARLEDRRFEVQAIAARLRARGPELARTERTLAADPFLPGATPTLAANAFQRRIVAVAEEAGVTLKTIGAEPAGDVEAGELPHIVLQASATARVGPLQAFLYRIETEAPFVLVDELTIRAPQAPAGGNAAPSLDPDLEVELRLYGYPARKEG